MLQFCSKPWLYCAVRKQSIIKKLEFNPVATFLPIENRYAIPGIVPDAYLKIITHIKYTETVADMLPSKNLKIKIYKTIMLPVALYGFEAWSFTLREECRLRV